MSFALLAVATVVGVATGRIVFGRWYNHIGLYSVVWGAALTLFELRLIQYYPLEPETWMLIGGAWIAFMIGAVMVPAGRYAVGIRERESGAGKQEREDPGTLIRLLWALNGVTLLHAVYQAYLSLKLMGGLTNLIVWGNLLYSYRVAEGLPGTIPYLGHLSLTGSLLGGVVMGRTGRPKVVAVLPLVIVMAEAIANMGRSTMLIAGILFMSGYVIERGWGRRRERRRRYGMMRRIGIPVLVVGLLAVGAEVVRSTRGTYESFPGETGSLRKLKGLTFVTPSIYLYGSVHIGVFNQYLKEDGEHVQAGNYTFAPVWRILSKLGFETYVRQYQPFYQTPTRANTGTYLREVHADFGPAGVIVVPLLLGMMTTWSWERYRRRRELVDLVILGHLNVVIGMSIFVMATQWGYWWISLIPGMVLALAVRRFGKTYNTKNRAFPAAGIVLQSNY